MSVLTKPFDALLKSIFEEAIIKIFYSLGFDFEIKERAKMEYPKLSESLKPDFLYKVNYKGKQAEEILLHLEFQSTNDASMHRR
ncbi:MAG: hypothetical protein ACTSRZ_11070, partial [Promethearchaeota archaeon]